LHALEMRNAIELNVFRGRLNSVQAAQIWGNVVNDLKLAKLVPISINWPVAWRHARKDSASHGRIIGARSLDILHTACARVTGARTFFSFDEKQRKFAAAVGLNVLP
jgi:predicted nucleic acid-binding protein